MGIIIAIHSRTISLKYSIDRWKLLTMHLVYHRQKDRYRAGTLGEGRDTDRLCSR